MDIASTQWHTSRVDPIEEPLIPAFLRQVKTESSITEELKKIYELKFHGSVPLTPVIFKCHWFDPTLTRHTPSVCLVEIRQDSTLQGKDVYIVAQQAIQVYYLSYPCQTDHRLRGWDVVYKVSPHGKLPLPNNEDYNNDREFFQEEGLQGSFEIDLSDEIGMEVDNEREVDEEGGDEVQNIQDLQLLERLRLGRDSEDNITPFKTCRTRNI